MDLRIKIFIYWLAITLILGIITKVRFKGQKPHITWEYFREYDCYAIFYLFLLYGGLISIAFYLFVEFSVWYFKY